MPHEAPLGNPIDSLVRIAEQLRSAGDMAHAEWIDTAITRHIETGDSLDRALGLSGSLGRSPRFAYLRRERGRHLADALRHLGDDLPRLADEIKRFETRVLRALRCRSSPPADWSPARVAIHRAFLVGLSVPASVDGLRKALAAAD
jgi:hypothetical protein